MCLYEEVIEFMRQQGFVVFPMIKDQLVYNRVLPGGVHIRVFTGFDNKYDPLATAMLILCYQQNRRNMLQFVRRYSTKIAYKNNWKEQFMDHIEHIQNNHKSVLKTYA
jgi:hypothetical protein